MNYVYRIISVEHITIVSSEDRRALHNTLLSERRQTMLFSATQTRKTEDLARISLKKEPLYVGVDDKREKATVEGLEQVRRIKY